MNTLTLVPADTTIKQPKSISVFNEKDKLLAKVFCDAETEFSAVSINIDKLKQIVTIAENFNLFWSNLYN